MRGSVSSNKIEIFGTLRNLCKSANEGCSTEEGEECHDVPGLKCSVESSEHCSNVEREVCHDEMTQECATEYSEECSTEMKEECFESSGHECTTETSEQCKDVQRKVCHDQPTERCSTEYSFNDFSKPNLIWFGIFRTLTMVIKIFQTNLNLESASCKISIFLSKPNWNWFGKSFALFGCYFSKPN